jgi:hypothetical protein
MVQPARTAAIFLEMASGPLVHAYADDAILDASPAMFTNYD